MSPDNGTTINVYHEKSNISSFNDFRPVPDSERIVTKFTKSNQGGEGNKKGVGPDENECEES